MLSLKSLKIQPAGFGRCRQCPYYETGPAALCFACAHQTITRLAGPHDRCSVCDLPYEPNEDFCRNPICKWNEYRRFFDWNFAIAMREGEIERVINRYKIGDRPHWATIFARVLVGFLEEEQELFSQFDLIVASPTFTSRRGGAREWDHTGRVIEIAHGECAGLWPFDCGDTRAIIKTAATPRMTERSWRERHEIAEHQLRDSLKVTDADRTRGKDILVYDDVFTDGHTLNEVARCLKFQGGARRVCGITLTRQPWRRPPAI